MTDLVTIEIPLVHWERLITDRRFVLVKEEYKKNKTGSRATIYESPYKITKKYLCFKVIFIPANGNYPGQCFIKGSLHKFYNIQHSGREQNYDQFTYSKLFQSIGMLGEVFGFTPEEAVVRNLEFGLNLNISKMPQNLIEEHIVMYKTKAPVIKDNFEGGGYLSRFIMADYEIKIYDKTQQYKLDQNVLRIEFKTYRMRPVFGRKKIYLTDLTDKGKLLDLLEKLKEVLENTIIVDSLDFTGVTIKRHRDFLTKNIFPQRINLLSGKKKSDANSRLICLLMLHGQLGLKNQLLSQIEVTWMNLLNDRIPLPDPKPIQGKVIEINPVKDPFSGKLIA